MYTALYVVLSAIVTLAALLAGTGVLHLVPKLGTPGRRMSEFLCRAPGLDVVILYFTGLPLVLGPALLGWAGLVGAVAGQVATVISWSFLHELAHRDAVRGPRIVKVINRLVGRWRNHAALWVTAIVTPLFTLVRIAEVLFYPLMVWLVGFPRYRQGEWVNVSRQKFQGLVGHDLIWCLYCDWMTGVWSLGTEILRNVESFWCPIRFASDKKCANCCIDFPDLDKGWVEAGGTMQQVTDRWEEMYNAPGPNTWFGHPVRLTVKGTPVEAEGVAK